MSSGRRPSIRTRLLSTCSRTKRRLTSLNASLKYVVARVQHANEESRLMVAHCLTLVKNTLNFFGRWSNSVPVYGASGSVESYGSGHGRIVSNSV